MTKDLDNDKELSSSQAELDITPPDEQMSEVQNLLSKLPQEMLIEALNQRKRNGTEIRVKQSISQSYSGPLPPPGMLHDYAQYAERIVTMAEKEQAHRHNLESTAVSGAINKDKRSQNYALFCIVFPVLLHVYKKRSLRQLVSPPKVYPWYLLAYLAILHGD